MLTESRMLIDGKLVDAVSGKTFVNINPATEEPIGEAADCSADEVHAAVGAARRAFDETAWSTDHALRRRCIEQLQAAFSSEREALRELVVAETGAPVGLTYIVQLDSAIASFPHWAEMATGYEWETKLPDIAAATGPSAAIKRKEPAGVVAAITPFNFPVYLIFNKLLPALAAGCTVVLKPSPETPFTATVLGRFIAEKTDIPPGVVNIVTTSEIEPSQALVADPRVDMVSFTGSTATGKRIMATAAEDLKKIHLELGGKSANIVLDDADLPTALGLGAAYACTHSGQGCALYTRILLPRSRYEEALEMLTPMIAGFPYGDPTDPAVLMGPQISERQRERVLDFIEKGKADGARLLAGGSKPDRKGFFVEPTLFADVDPDSTIAQEEIFGPVLSAIPYEDVDDAVRIANNSLYGLSGAVWSADAARATEVARRVRTGCVSVNGGDWYHWTRPFGGYKHSGIGRESGIEGFEEYLETKVLALPGS